MKKKLAAIFGTFGVILYWIIRVIIAIIPVFILDLPFWADSLIFLAIEVFPPISIVVWIWSFIVALQTPIDIFVIIYFISFVIVFVPFMIGVITDLISWIKYR